jgi:hypothetical protein
MPTTAGTEAGNRCDGSRLGRGVAWIAGIPTDHRRPTIPARDRKPSSSPSALTVAAHPSWRYPPLAPIPTTRTGRPTHEGAQPTAIKVPEPPATCQTSRPGRRPGCWRTSCPRWRPRRRRARRLPADPHARLHLMGEVDVPVGPCARLPRANCRLCYTVTGFVM